ncbi:glycine cleavage system aminomethyltransferase GcvT [Marinomonas sp. M1K-6]|uniref:aminomethyltransferase n=1 Tax=Marinomonas profundi TaxID=2726122 RepID=A0A847R4A2_9GAMM|nr:glycine cleavage system aminomethyltransferase GcvT [Marinomonas profundi]NLQ18811.1 glycine cleavage system aminomethyltransferase GcvT [Marinomonas profundi]UDV02983.1 glycine cleavage system aminomethyltransferase GcvT [Marinomonas profundi]
MKRTALCDLHIASGARMVEFAGYEMPVQYPLGVMKEHLWVRENVGLFDVSHMGQVMLRGENVKTSLEAVLPVDVLGLAEGMQRYGMFTTEKGGISDDLMFANWGDDVFMVVNAGCKEQDIAYLKASLVDCEVDVVDDRALLAIQGPKARDVFARMVPDVATMKFMQSLKFQWQGVELWVSCSGYTGEDGYEVSVPNSHAEAFANALLAFDEVEWIGLGARDSLRLEAGLCLYGHDIDTNTTPVEASINWAIQKVRRLDGERAGGFPGADIILPQFTAKPARKRVGFLVDGRAPVREGVEIVDAAGDVKGSVTSGGFSPTLAKPIVMAYVSTQALDADEPLFANVRGKKIPLAQSSMPFVPSRYYRG